MYRKEYDIDGNLIIELTKEEIYIAKGLAKGLNNIEIAENLHISVHTVKHRIRRIIYKADAKNRTHAIAILAKLKII